MFRSKYVAPCNYCIMFWFLGQKIIPDIVIVLKNTISDSRNKLAEDEEREGKTFVEFHAKLKGKDVQNLTVKDSSSSQLKMYKYHWSHICTLGIKK